MEAVWADSRLDPSRVRPKSAVATGYTRFQDGDVLLPKITPTFEAGRSVLISGLHNGAGAGTTELHVLRPTPEIEPRFLTYVTQSYSFLKLGEAEMYGVAGQKRVPDDFVRDFVVELPAIEEQWRIADFLDAETSRIGKQINAHARLRALVHDRELSILESLLVPTLARQDAVDDLWHWKPLAALTDPSRPIMYGIVLPGPNVEDGIPIVKGGDVAAKRLNSAALNKTSREIEGRYARSRLRGGDLVIAIRGSVGEVAAVPDELTGANLTQDAARISVGRRINSRWLELVLQTPTVAQEIQSKVTGATIKGINICDLKRVAVPVPSDQNLQANLARQADLELSRHERIMSASRRQTVLLNERRQALISAAVTGKIDVTLAARATEWSLT